MLLCSLGALRAQCRSALTSQFLPLVCSSQLSAAHSPGFNLARGFLNQSRLGPQQPPSQLDVDAISEAFTKSPETAADQVAASLGPVQKAILAAALHKHAAADREAAEDKYIQELFEAADIDGDKGKLTKLEFAHAMRLHKALDGSHVRTPPSWRELSMVFFASALPFVGFGFLDNFIMLVAGEEIDTAFGVKMGLSTLASAGLGNLVADVIGVGAANGIEQGVKKLPMVRDFKLSKHQAAMRRTKVAKATGASIGVMVGCVLGLAPLFMGGNFFVDRT